ncbi:MAG: amidohydrolase family protein [Terriglobales bacterium]
MSDREETGAIPGCQGYNPDPGKPRLAIPAGSSDCHAHIFGPQDRYPYTPNRSYTPPEASIEAYRRMLGALGFERAVIVQPSVYGTDNRCTRDAVVASGGKWRGIAVVEPGVSDSLLAELHAAGFRGVRINLLFKGGLQLDVLERIARAIKPVGWHVQLLLDGRDLPELASRLGRLPVDIVVDHMGHMPASLGIGHAGFQTLLQLLRGGCCWVKLSGAYRISAKPQPYDDAVPFARALVETAADKLVFGTDWPHPSITVPMPQDASLLDLLPAWAPDEATRRLILVENPARLYDFPPARSGTREAQPVHSVRG